LWLSPAQLYSAGVVSRALGNSRIVWQGSILLGNPFGRVPDFTEYIQFNRGLHRFCPGPAFPVSGWPAAVAEAPSPFRSRKLWFFFFEVSGFALVSGGFLSCPVDLNFEAWVFFWEGFTAGRSFQGWQMIFLDLLDFFALSPFFPPQPNANTGFFKGVDPPRPILRRPG